MSTLAVFRSVVSKKIGLDSTAAGVDEVLIDSWVNEGVIRVLTETNCYVVAATLTPGATADYALTSATLKIVDAYFTSSGTVYPLERVTVQEIIDMRRATVAASTPTRYFALAGASTLMWYPTPGATDTLTLYHVPSPTVMSSGTHDPSSTTYGGIPVEYHKAIEFWALAEAGDYDDDQSSAEGQRYRELYANEISRIRGLINRKVARLPKAHAGRRKITPSRESDA